MEQIRKFENVSNEPNPTLLFTAQCKCVYMQVFISLYYFSFLQAFIVFPEMGKGKKGQPAQQKEQPPPAKEDKTAANVEEQSVSNLKVGHFETFVFPFCFWARW